MTIDLLIHNIGLLATCAGPAPKKGAALDDVGLKKDAAVAVDAGQVVAVGDSSELCQRYAARKKIDARKQAVVPGFVDAHTHLIWAGDRTDEFEQRLAGASYLEILASGGGILQTVQVVRKASLDDLVAASRPRLAVMLQLGTTTAEVKSGYGLTLADELKMLQVAEKLHETQPVDLVPTFLGAHAVPAEARKQPQDYVRQVVTQMLPAAAQWHTRSVFARRKIPLFNDVFCEAGAFDLAQTRQILEAGLALGLPAKIHADEFTSLGAVGLAAELKAVSVDHLDVTTTRDGRILAAADTIGVLMPAVNFHLGASDYADGRQLAAAGAAISLATDINPGSAPCPSMPLVMALACRYNGLRPAQALNAATINAACAIGLGHSVGSIEKGKQADLLILDTDDWRHLVAWFGANIVGTVIKSGVVV